MEQYIATNAQMEHRLASDPSDEKEILREIATEKIDELAGSISKYENGLYVFLHPGFGPGKYARFSESAAYDNGGATSFRLHHLITRVRHISPSAALSAATRLSETVFCRLQALGVAEAGAILCLAVDEPGKEEWDYRFLAGLGAETAAGKTLTADQPVAVFRPRSLRQQRNI